MKIAIPVADGVLCPHFGHCQQFVVMDVDTERKEITKTETLTPPPHEPGALPEWLGGIGCSLIIAGGMGGRAIGMFGQKGITVVCGAPPQKPDKIVMAYLNEELATSANLCDEPAFHAGVKDKYRPHKRHS